MLKYKMSKNRSYCTTNFHCYSFLGAGDAFVGSFAHYISVLTLDQREDCDAIRHIIQKACAVATFSVQRQGTQASFPHPSDLLSSSVSALSL